MSHDTTCSISKCYLFFVYVIGEELWKWNTIWKSNVSASVLEQCSISKQKCAFLRKLTGLFY